MCFVYRLLDSNDNTLYIGKTKNIDKRIKSHFSFNGNVEIECYEKCEKIEYIKLDTNTDMDLAEIYLINKYEPIFNKASNHKDSCSILFNLKENWTEYKFDLIKEKFNLINKKNKMLEKFISELTTLKEMQLEISSRINAIEEAIGSKILRNGEDYIKCEGNEYSQFKIILNSISEIINNEEYEEVLFRNINEKYVVFDIKNSWEFISENADISRNDFLKVCKNIGIFEGNASDYYKAIRFKKSKLVKAYKLNREAMNKILREAN